MKTPLQNAVLAPLLPLFSGGYMPVIGGTHR